MIFFKFLSLLIVVITIMVRTECSSYTIQTPSGQQQKTMKKKQMHQERKSDRQERKAARDERRKKQQNKQREQYQKTSLLKKSPKQMNDDELQTAQKYALDHKLYDNASKIIERAIFVKGSEHQGNQDEEVRILRLELADIHFEKGDFTRADNLYDEYLTLYPGCDKEQAEYVQYKKILCRFYACLKPDVDQSKTRRTIEITLSYLNKENGYAKYIDEVQKIQNTCFDHLFTHEANILTFYSKQGQKAEARLRDLKKEFQPVMSQFEHRIIELEIALAQIEGDAPLVTAKREELTAKFPTYATAVAEYKAKKSHVDRF